jgi:hypothetical protein
LRDDGTGAGYYLSPPQGSARRRYRIQRSAGRSQWKSGDGATTCPPATGSHVKLRPGSCLNASKNRLIFHPTTWAESRDSCGERRVLLGRPGGMRFNDERLAALTRSRETEQGGSARMNCRDTNSIKNCCMSRVEQTRKPTLCWWFAAKLLRIDANRCSTLWFAPRMTTF